MRAANVLVEALRREGTEVIFGIPGGVVMPIYDALYDSEIRHFLVRHEQGAVHAADGYARASGKVGVCMATSGPGATNLVTGIANAYLDSVPMVAITGQVRRALIGTDAFQEADTTGITLPVVKHSYLITDPADIPRIVHEAFYIAGTGRPGPVLIDVPSDVVAEDMEYDPEAPLMIDLPGYRPTLQGHPKQIKAAARAIAEAERPVLYAGGGIVASGASDDLRELAFYAHIPVTTTLTGIGCFPEDHVLSLGMLGMHGTPYANYAIQNCDLVFAVGVRFDDRATGKLEAFAPNAKVVHIDIDPAEISKNVSVDIPIVGDAKRTLHGILKELKKFEPSADRHLPWMRQVADWKAEHPMTFTQDPEGEILPEYVVSKLREVTRGEAIVTTEVGQNQMWAAQYSRTKHPRHFITSGGLGTMGFGLPAAIGAKVARPELTVVDVAGDGSIQMNIQELGTAVNYGLAVKVCILNNMYLGMVRQWQELFYQKRYASTCIACQPDFVKLAEAYGAEGYRAIRPDEVEEVLRVALASDRPALIDFRIKREANVWPMVPAGASISNMLMGGGVVKHTLSVLVENKPGVLTRIAGLFARRGFNIDSLAVGETEDPRLSRMIITVDAQDAPLEQVTKQLHKLINVIKITDLDPASSVDRELILVKVKADAESRSEIMQIVEIFRGKIVDVARSTLIIEATGTREKLSAMLQLFQPFGIVELVRAGRISMGRDKKNP